jgi:hypothetical protein
MLIDYYPEIIQVIRYLTSFNFELSHLSITSSRGQQAVVGLFSLYLIVACVSSNQEELH